VGEPEEREEGGREEGGREEGSQIGLEHAPGLVRLYLGSWLRTVGWVRGRARGLPGMREVEERLSQISSSSPTVGGEQGSSGERTTGPAALRKRGSDLLARSAELEGDEVHPAFAAIVGELAPDEARILRLVADRGPQPLVDVQSVAPLGGSRRVGRRLSLMAENAGVMHAERLQAYLDNLARLGLARISREPVADESAYQVLAAQPAVAEALERAGGGVRGKRIVRLSLRLTDLGELFCESVLPD
jgi:hypothetical protein